MICKVLREGLISWPRAGVRYCAMGTGGLQHCSVLHISVIQQINVVIMKSNSFTHSPPLANYSTDRHCPNGIRILNLTLNCELWVRIKHGSFIAQVILKA